MTHILLIEDDIEGLDTTAELLELEGFKITRAVNGKEGLQKMANQIPDLVLCDILMPEMDGLQLLQEMGKHPKFNTIPFIFFSAKSEKTDIKKGIDMGADDYLTKPFELDDLLRSIKRSLQKRKSSQNNTKAPMDLEPKFHHDALTVKKKFRDNNQDTNTAGRLKKSTKK